MSIEIHKKEMLQISLEHLTKTELNMYMTKNTICLNSQYSFKYLELYKKDSKYLYLPREFELLAHHKELFKVKDCNNYHEWDFNLSKLKMEEQFSLRDYQVEAVEKVIHALKNKQSGILECPAGGGKTNMAIWITQQLGLKTLFISDQYELLEQTYERFSQFGNIQPNILSAGKKQNNYSGVTLTLFQSLARNEELLNEVKDSYGLIIIDECHISAAETYNSVLQKLNGVRLGLTATNRRKDKLDWIYKAHIGNVLAKVHVEMLKPQVYWIKYESKNNTIDLKTKETESSIELNDEIKIKTQTLDSLLSNMHQDSQEDNYVKIIQGILRDKDRNDIILKILEKYYSNRRILVISANIEHIEYLSYICKCLKIDSSKLHSKQTKKANTENLEAFKSKKTNILFTVNKANKGMDIADLDMLILCVGGNNDVHWEQRVGRIQRFSDGKNSPIVFDFADQKYDMLRAMARNRAKYYKNKEFSQSLFETQEDLLDFLKDEK